MNMNTCCCTKGSLFGIESLILGSHSSDLYKAGPGKVFKYCNIMKYASYIFVFFNNF